MHPFSAFTGNLITTKPDPWSWGASSSEITWIDEVRQVIRFLRDHGVNVAAVVGEYHRCRLMPRMARALPLWRLGPNDRVVDDMVMMSAF